MTPELRFQVGEGVDKACVCVCVLESRECICILPNPRRKDTGYSRRVIDESLLKGGFTKMSAGLPKRKG